MNRRSDQPLLIIDVSLPRNVSEDEARTECRVEHNGFSGEIAMENANRRRKKSAMRNVF